ncbi:12525_t:CDS:2, partial [Acaulospora colombiana]
GNPAYNASKAAVKSITESLAHDLLSILDGRIRVQYMFERVRCGDFYIIVPDNEVSARLDKLRMRWAADDIPENRPALSRWHPEWQARFEEYIKGGLEHDRRRRQSPYRGVVVTEGDAGVE